MAAADAATSTHVMRNLYDKMRSAPFDPGLAKIWKDLGVRSIDGEISFDDTAPLAAIRRAITSRPGGKVTN